MTIRFPLFVDLQGKRCVVIGAGPLAFRRTQILLEWGAQVHVVAPDIWPDFHTLKSTRMTLTLRGFEPSDLNGAFLCVAATNQPTINAHIATLAQKQRIWANIASDANLGDFHFPSLLRQGPVVVGLHAGGQPALAKRLKKWLSHALLHWKDAK